MSRFNPGQKVILMYGYAWSINNYGPKIHEVVTVDRYVDEEFIVLQEYLFDPSGEEQSFEERAFEPLQEITEIHNILFAEPITETV